MLCGLQREHQLFEHPRELGFREELRGGVLVTVGLKLPPPGRLHWPKDAHI